MLSMNCAGGTAPGRLHACAWARHAYGTKLPLRMQRVEAAHAYGVKLLSYGSLNAAFCWESIWAAPGIARAQSSSNLEP
jgi:hypothetical protein